MKSKTIERITLILKGIYAYFIVITTFTWMCAVDSLPLQVLFTWLGLIIIGIWGWKQFITNEDCQKIFFVSFWDRILGFKELQK